MQYIEISFAPCMTWMDTRIDVNLSNANDDMKDGSQTPYINLPSSTEDSTIWIPDICKVRAYNFWSFNPLKVIIIIFRHVELKKNSDSSIKMGALLHESLQRWKNKYMCPGYCTNWVSYEFPEISGKYKQQVLGC